MRLHLKFFYALMLILLTHVLINNTCRGQAQKRAIDFDEIADFVDITEAEPAQLQSTPVNYVEKSIAKVRDINIDIDLLKDAQVPLPLLNDLRSIRKSYNEHSASRMSAAEDMLTTSNSDVDKILNFRMKQFKHLPARSAVRRNLYKRYVNLPVQQIGGSYLGHLADATNDVNLKMQNYAATIMVVLTTAKREVKATALETKVTDTTDSLAEIKTILTPRSQHLEVTTDRVTKSESTDAIFKSDLTGIPFTTMANKYAQTTSKDRFTTRLGRSEDDYPLFGADGFYTEHDALEERDKRSKSGKRDKRDTDYRDRDRERDSDNSFVETGNFDQLLRVIPVKIGEDHTPDPDNEGPHKAKPSLGLGSSVDNHKHHSGNTPAPREPITASLATTISSTGRTDPLAVSDQEQQYRHSVTHSHTVTTANTNPYLWENDIIKELNIKFKKDVGSAVSTAVPNTSIGVTAHPGTVSAATIVTAGPSTVSVSGGTSATTATSTAATGSTCSTVTAGCAKTGQSCVKVVRENGDLLTTTPLPTTSRPPSTGVVQLDGGGTANVPICKSSECQEMHSHFYVYNDTAGDCNREDDKDVGTGGYNIVSNDETPTTPLVKVKCPINMTRTEPPTSTTVHKCTDENPMSPCEANEELDQEPCDTNIQQQKQQACKKEKKKFRTHHKAKKPIDKRQIHNTPSINYPSPPQMNYNYQSPPNYYIQQQSSFLPNTDLSHLFNSFTPQLQTTQYTNSPVMTGNPTYLNSVSNPYPNSMPLSPTSMATQIDHLVKKSADKNVISSVIDNLKIVDQKLSDAVEPLHCAQEQLDSVTKCDTTTAACAEFSSRGGGSGEGTGDGLLKDLSEAEKSALSRLAIKIIAQNSKCKRDGPPMVVAPPVMPVDQVEREMAKRGVVKMFAIKQPYESKDYDDYGDQDRLSRLQRDISVAQEVELIVEQIKKRQSKRVKRNFLTSHNADRTHDFSENSEQSYDEFGANNLKNFLYEHEDPKLTRSLDVINTRVKNDEAYQTPKKRVRPKKFWRKLFGLTSNRSNNRFLDQDIPNSQSVHESRKKKKKNI